MKPWGRACMTILRQAAPWPRILTFSSSAPASRESERPAISLESGRRTTFAILEARDAIGGTWDLFRYPGVRSDSEMSTFGYAFRPWDNSKAIADGPSILRYLAETAKAYGVDRHVRFGLKVVRASWRSADARWALEIDGPDGETARVLVQLSLPVHGLLRICGRLQPKLARHGEIRRARRASADMA